MLQQCGQYQSSAYPCSCGVAYGGCGCGSGGGGGSGNSYTFLFPVTGKQYMDECSDTSGSNSYSTSLVDCTLSLGTPSTRQTENRALAAATHIQQPSSMSNFCWDVISQSKNSSLGPNVSTGAAGLGSDPLLLARRCANCDTTSTPLWRNGPRGPKSLCNACGIRYKKEERRAAASMVPPSPSPAATEQGIGSGYHRRQQQTPWSCYSSSTVKSSSSFAMYNDVTGNGDAAAPYLSWQFSIAPSSQMQVQDRPSLFQYN